MNPRLFPAKTLDGSTLWYGQYRGRDGQTRRVALCAHRGRAANLLNQAVGRAPQSLRNQQPPTLP
jgi:hypothetical protein